MIPFPRPIGLEEKGTPAWRGRVRRKDQYPMRQLGIAGGVTKTLKYTVTQWVF